MADSFRLKAIITGVNRLSPTLTTMQKDLRKFKGEFTAITQGAAALGVAITTAFIAPIQAAIDFESSMADVRKVVDFDNVGQFKEMADDILLLSTELPMAANGIAQIYAAGGQSGIARGELKAFATDAIKMGVAFDQTAEESGQMMAQWRTAFKMNQDEVRSLADQINYLGNTGPANAGKISDIVTRIGSLGKVGGLTSGSIAALGSTIAGMGIPSEIAATGIKNFMIALNSGRASGLQKKVYKALKIDPKKLASDMQKDSKGAIISILKSISKLPKAKQTSALEILFGRESIAAIAPLLTNLDLLSSNFEKVTKEQLYSGSMQKEYESRAKTTANAIALLKNQIAFLGVTIGDAFLPSITEALEKLKPFLLNLRQFAKENPELLKTTFKLGIFLAGVAIGITAVAKSMQFMAFITQMSPLGKLMTLLIGAGALIAANWEDVGPVFKQIWEKIKPIVDLVKEWHGTLDTLSTFVAVTFLQSFLAGMGSSGVAVAALTRLLGALLKFSGKLIVIGVLIELVNQLNELSQKGKEQGKSSGQVAVDNLKLAEEARGYHGFIPRLKELLGLDKYDQMINDGRGTTLNSVGAPRQSGELTVKFEGAPAGMTVEGIKSTPGLNVGYDVGYSRFSSQSISRG
jgi:TP901 family phage tail tape measure protein